MSEIFTDPKHQALRLLDANDNLISWKDKAITEAAIEAAGEPPECPVSDKRHLFCVTLVYETGNPLLTIQRNWRAFEYVHGSVAGQWTRQWERFVFSSKGFQLRHGAQARPRGFRWIIGELGRFFRNTPVQEVRRKLDLRGVMGLGVELPLIGALHSRWIEIMDGFNYPYVDAPDTSVAENQVGNFDRAAFLAANYRRHNRCLELSAGPIYRSYPLSGSGYILRPDQLATSAAL